MKRVLAMDLECYPNYFLAKFMAVDNRAVRSFAMRDGVVFDRHTVDKILSEFTIVTFNGMHYDMPILALALSPSGNNALLKKASDDIIQNDLRNWQFEKKYHVKVSSQRIDHIDLKETVPGVQISLKLYGARLHSQKLQDLPYPPDKPLTEQEMQNTDLYCENDLHTTVDLYLAARNPKDDIIATRERLTKEYNVDVRSKSDAQCAEAIIKKLVETKIGEQVYRREVAPGTIFKYNPPAFISFKTQALQEKLAEIVASNFVVLGDGKVKLPAALNSGVKIGDLVYKMGIGGLHSTEKSRAVIANDEVLIRDIDATSFYPSLIIQCGLSPESLGQYFQEVFRGFFNQRVAAKKSGNNSLAQTLKIFLNGTFGKLGSPYSILYAPNLLIQVTVTGQLLMLMIIERMALVGIPCVSANTDGVVLACPKDKEQTMLGIVAEWEAATGIKTEETRYRALLSRDVNNYIALKEHGGFKTKGVFSDPGFSKNPRNMIVNDAVCEYLDKGEPIANTILACRDLRKFLSVTRVTGGATFRGEYLGKVVRWYRGRNSSEFIKYGPGKKEGHKVPSSDNAVPVMELPDSFPDDLDYDFYINEAQDVLRELGVLQ